MSARLDLAVAAMREADNCDRHNHRRTRRAHREGVPVLISAAMGGCDACALLALLAALRVVLAEPSDAAALEASHPYTGGYTRVRAAFAADLAALEAEAKR